MDGKLAPDQYTLPAELAALGQERPGTYFAGATLYAYPLRGNVASSVIQYTRVWLLEGQVIGSMETFVADGANGRAVNVGIYDQANPLDRFGVPLNKLGEIGSQDTAGITAAFVNRSLGGAVTIAATGYYWVAVVADSNQVKVALTGFQYRENFLPTYRETTTGVTLPATASNLTNPQSAVVYAAAIESGF